MNPERQKTDTLSDAVEIPDGATHVDHTGRYWNLVKGTIWINNEWVVDTSGHCFLWYSLQ